MKCFKSFRQYLALLIVIALTTAAAGSLNVFAQSRRQPPTTNEKKNKRPDPAAQKPEEQTPTDVVNKPQEAEKVTISTNIVNVDAVVYQKKGGQIMMGLKKPNFAIFVDGVQKEITNFSTPEAPITGTLDHLSGFYLSKIKERQPLGPYLIGGFSFGGWPSFGIISKPLTS